MKKDKFAVILPVILGGLINKIIEETNVSDEDAFLMLYNSELYVAIETEKTKVWTYSIPKLFEIYKNEINTGKLELPDY